MTTPARVQWANRPNGLRTGEPAYDLVRNRPVVITDYLGTIGTVDAALREVIEDAYSNAFVPLPDEMPLYDVAYLSLTSEPSKTYAFPASRLARPPVELIDGWSAREHAEIAFAAELFAAAGDEQKPVLADVIETIRSDPFSSAALSRYTRDGGAREPEPEPETATDGGDK